MVIAWILGSVSEPIRRSVMFMKTAEDIWKHLESRYCIANGARKYQLSKMLFGKKQDGKLVNEYYIELRAIWQELNKKNEIKCTNYEKQGHTMEKCWACKACGKGGHTYEKCWTVVGYPPKFNNSKNLKNFKGKGKEEGGKSGNVKETTRNDQRWSKGKQEGKDKLAANVWSESDKNLSGGITASQLEKLLKMLPIPYKGGDSENEEEMEANLIELIICNMAQSVSYEWIIESGATHHMTGNGKFLSDVVKSQNQPKISMPTGHTTGVTEVGNVKLENDLCLKNILHIPAFKYNLMSVQKLTEQENCKVIFHPQYCIIHEEVEL
ncbi:Retrovirus-related Pol polyprotein from transposon RE1 [Bienertia sinuspersici]